MMRYIVILLLFAFSIVPSLAKTTENADSLVLLGREYYKAEKYMDALDILAKAMDVADQTHNDKAYMESLLPIGNIYTVFNDYEQALHYYTICLNKANAVKNIEIEGKAKSNILLCYTMLGKVKEAEECYKSIGNLQTEDVNMNRFHDYVNQALLAKVRKNYKAAIYFQTQAMEYAKNHKMQGYLVAAGMGQIASLYQESGDLKKAEEWFLKCAEYSKNGHFIGPLTSTYERLANLYRETGKNDLSVQYQEQFVHLEDSFFQQREFNNKRNLLNKYEKKQSDRLISSLTDRNTTLIWVIALIATLLIILVGLIIYISRVNRRLVHTQRLLIEKHQEHSHQLQVQNELFMSMNEGKEDVAPVEVKPVADEPMDNEDEGEAPVEEDLLTRQQADHLLMAIAHVMEDNSVICNPDFSLTALAQMVGSNTKYVSWVINKNYGKNFKTYLNEYRIRAASQLLKDSANFGNLTIAGIAEQVGYKSPTSFHQAFKRIYGMTPAAFVKLTQTED